MNIEFEHLQNIDLNQNNEERPFIQLEIPKRPWSLQGRFLFLN
mgnify:CR=1 FL=1